MKQIISFLICSFTILIVNAQTISPLQSNEFCPSTEYTFTVTILKTYQSMIGEGGCFVTQLPTPPVGTTFTFKGKFADANQKQIFRIYYTDGTNYGFEFKKIKSLFYSTTGCSPIQPNQATITAPRCQVSNFNISFNNIQWGTAFETPLLCFGSITTYEYQLPNGWSIGSNVSTGSNWIAGGNNITVTSDLSNGDESTIKIRPTNNCGTGLSNGQAPSQISISRPAPNLSITTSGNTNYICSGSRDYTINGMPAGATVSWQISDPALATIPPNSTSPTVTVTKVGGNGAVTLTATVMHCTFTYTVTKNIPLGSPSFIGTSEFASGSNGPHTLSSANFMNASVADLRMDQSLGYYYYNWSITQGSVYSWWSDNIYGTVHIDLGPNAQSGQNFYLNLTAYNNCGALNERYFVYYSPCTSCSYRVSPNPAKSSINVSSVTESNKVSSKFYMIKITDQIGNIKKIVEFKSGITSANISLAGIPPGIYLISIFDGKIWNSQQMIVQ